MEEKKEEGKTVAMTSPEERKPLSQQEMKMLQKKAAMDLADYKKRLRDSVDLKRLQVEEVKLNIEYYHASKEYEKITKLMQQEEEQRKAEAEKVMKETKSKIIKPDNKIIAP
mgnify:CR=1 FL=1